MPFPGVHEGPATPAIALARAVNNLLRGKLNVTRSAVTLAANAATTALNDARIGADTFIGFEPTTANAAAALGGLYMSGKTNGSVTLNHANNAQTDKTFNILLIG